MGDFPDCDKPFTESGGIIYMKLNYILIGLLVALMFSGTASAANFTFDVYTASNGDTFALPLELSGTYDFDIAWGDNNSDHITAHNQLAVTHTYAIAGTHEININGTIQGWRFDNGGDCAKIRDIKSWGCLLLGNSNGYFQGCTGLTVSATDNLNLTGTTTLREAFRSCISLTTVPSMNAWDVSNVNNLYATFFQCSHFNQDIGNWDTGKVTNTGYMLQQAGAFEQDIGGWDITSLTIATAMFSGVTLSTTNYDALLIGWEAQAENPNVVFHAGSSKYTSEPAITARASLIANGWTITDGGVINYINITLHSTDPPGDVNTDYTGVMVSRYLVESNTPLNCSSLAFLAGVNNTVTSDMHSHIKVPANTIAADGIYRAHFRNTTPALLWKDNTTLTNGNIWQWAGYDNNSVAITKESINNTHTWINVTGHTSIVFPSMYYIDVAKQVGAPMTPVHINKHQGIIMKVWDLEHLRGRSNDYWVNMFFDTALQATPDSNIDLWYCNASFDPTVDDPITCEYCVRMDTWESTRWMDNCPIQFHPNSSYAKPLTVYAGQDPDAPPDTINYIYLTSETVTSKSYILNAMNYDPGICNITYAQTETMWLRDEIAGTTSPYAYTPNLYLTFVRDYTEFLYSFHIQNAGGAWDSNYNKSNIGVANVLPTHTKFNYFWWGNETDYNMTGQYVEDFWINVTYGTDPDNGAALDHVLSLYTAGGTFVTTVNDTLTGNGTDTDIFCAVSAYTGRHRFQIISTDNEGTSTTSWSELFYLSSGTDEEIPLDLFIVLMIMMFGSLFYIYHAETYVSKIVTSMITMWLAFMLSGMIISGTVVLNYAELSSADAFVYGSYAIQIASLSHFFMFIGVVSTLFMLGFAVMLVADTYSGMQEKNKTENEWDGVDEQ